ncbi:MAG: M1 family metallopeptidase [Syntrophomonas sp.]
MLRHKIYIFLILIGVLSATNFIYVHLPAAQMFSSLSPEQSEKETSRLFPDPGLTSYQMGLYLDINTRTLYGSTVLTTKNTWGKALNELWFTAYPNAFRNLLQTPAPRSAYYSGFDPGWLEFQEFKVNGQEVEYFLDGVSVQVVIPSDIIPGSDFKVEMKWQAKVPKLAYRYGTKDNVYMLGNFYPILNVLDKDGWHNSYNSVFGDPFCFNCADYLVSFNLPEGYRLVSSGENTETIAEDNGRETHFIQAQNARDFCLAVLYDYSESKEEKGRTAISCYFPNSYQAPSNNILRESGEILNFFACNWGSYPYPEFKVVFVPMKGFHGMEYSGLMFFSEDFLDPQTYQKDGDFILAHEIAHQWWFGMVGNDQLKEPWLDEGLASWSAYKYLEKYKGIKPPVNEKLKEGINLAREMREIYSTQEYYLTAYSGGEAFWIGLENEMGAETVNKVLRRYLADYRFKIATTSDLLEVIKKEAHKDMTEYFSKWFK